VPTEALRIVEGLGDEHTRFETLVVLVRVALAKRALDEGRAHCSTSRCRSAQHPTPKGSSPCSTRGGHGSKRVRARPTRRGTISRAPRSGWSESGRTSACGLLLNIARVHEALDEHLRARDRAEAALRLADSNGFRYYAMRARQILARVSRDDAVVARNARVADALARSLAANLPEDEAREFLELQAVPALIRKRRDRRVVRENPRDEVC
jgi:hypothetical protein